MRIQLSKISAVIALSLFSQIAYSGEPVKVTVGNASFEVTFNHLSKKDRNAIADLQKINPRAAQNLKNQLIEGKASAITQAEKDRQLMLFKTLSKKEKKKINQLLRLLINTMQKNEGFIEPSAELLSKLIEATQQSQLGTLSRQEALNHLQTEIMELARIAKKTSPIVLSENDRNRLRTQFSGTVKDFITGFLLEKSGMVVTNGGQAAVSAAVGFAGTLGVQCGHASGYTGKKSLKFGIHAGRGSGFGAMGVAGPWYEKSSLSNYYDHVMGGFIIVRRNGDEPYSYGVGLGAIVTSVKYFSCSIPLPWDYAELRRKLGITYSQSQLDPEILKMSVKEFKRFMDSQIADLSSTEVNEILDCELLAQDGPSTSAPQMAEINNEQICADIPPAYTSESYKKPSRLDRIHQQLRLAPSAGGGAVFHSARQGEQTGTFR